MPKPHDQQDEFARLAAEHASLREALATITLEWSHVENKFAEVLQRLLGNPEPHGMPGLLASAIYFAPTGAQVRIDIVDAAFVTLAEMSPDHGRIIRVWKRVIHLATTTRHVRNAVARGMIITVNSSSGKNHIRLTPPMADFRRIGAAIAKEQLPGLSSHDIMQSAQRMAELHKMLSRCAALAADLQDGKPPSPAILAQLEADLKIGPPEAETKPAPQTQHLSFRTKRKLERKALWKKLRRDP